VINVGCPNSASCISKRIRNPKRVVGSDLRRVLAVHLEVKGKHYLVCTELSGHAYEALRATGVVVPPGRWPYSGYVPLVAPEMLIPR